MGTRKTALASLLAASALVLHASRADAYCQTTLCANDTSGVACSPAQANDCGTPLHWAQGCFGYSLAERASKSVDRDLGPFFAAWGLPVSDKARAEVAPLEDWMPDGWPAPTAR